MADLLSFEKPFILRPTAQCHVYSDLNVYEKFIFGQGDFSELLR
jgi:hypothetical protein